MLIRYMSLKVLDIIKQRQQKGQTCNTIPTFPKLITILSPDPLSFGTSISGFTAALLQLSHTVVIDTSEVECINSRSS